MGAYALVITSKAKRDIRRLAIAVQEKVFAAIAKLAENPRPHGYIKMKDRDEYRIRVGDYRVVYKVFDRIVMVEVVEVGHRRDIYR